jgi:TonB family protein
MGQKNSSEVLGDQPWSPHMSLPLSQWLIHRAACRAPADLKERLEEEWSADLASRTSELSRLSFALGCCWATRVIAHEHPSLVPITQSAIGTKLMNAYAQHNMGFYSRRTMSLFMVIGAHAAVFAALLLTVSTTKVPVLPTPFVADVIDKPRPPRDLPQVDPVKTNINIRLPIDKIEFPPVVVDRDSAITGDPRSLLPVDTQPSQPPAHVARLQQGGTGAGFPDPASFYPSQSIRIGEVGVSVVRVCVNAKGRLTADPVTSKTSGFERLDLAALTLAKAGSGHYRPSTEDGAPVDSCYPVGVRFQLRN